jgi:aldehyde dehydrogenase (NAD+)
MFVPHEYDQLLIGGRWVNPRGDTRLRVYDPATHQCIGSCPEATSADALAAVAVARRTFDTGDWPRLSYAERAAYLDKLADALDDVADDLTHLIVHEMGSPIRWARPRQIPHPVAIAKLHAAMGRAFDRPDGGGPWPALTRTWTERGQEVHVDRQPAGVVVAITPWNMPVKTIMMKVAPALLAGCTVIVKPAPETPLDAIAFAAMASIAGLPDGVLTVLPGGDDLGRWLVQHPDVDKVAFTGSTKAGRSVAEHCARGIRRVSLELGGKSPAILLPDADGVIIDAMVASLRDEMFGNSGQVCSAWSRILVPEHLHNQVAGAVTELAESLVLGNPLDEATDVGPLVSQVQQHRVLAYIQAGIRDGARLMCGGIVPPDLPGWFVQPTVFADVANMSTLGQEEIFGPVVSLISYDGTDPDAVRIANQSDYGLEAAIWTADLDAAARIAGQLRAGTVRINGASPGLDAPLGGFKWSGIGRELGREGLDAYTEPQTIVLPA